MSRIQSRPTEWLSYSPTEAKYWDRQGLELERDRIFDICQSCRLCFNLCPSFPALFEAIDAKEGADVRLLSPAEKDRVTDLCYGCKLCEVRCPYTPADGHEFQLDFPRLMLRTKAVRAREHGVSLRERLLGNPDLMGKLGALTPRLANWGCCNKAQRAVMEVLLGIHRDKKLAPFARRTFASWLRKNPLAAPPADPAAKVALFYTCFANYYEPAPARAAVDVLSRNCCEVVCPSQNCCGMPALDGGNIEFAQRQASANVATLLPLVRRGYKVVTINPTCSLMMRREYPNLLAGAEVRELSAAVMDTHELLYELRRAGKFNREFRSTPKSVAYHVPCHLKAQGIGFRSRDLMRTIPGTEITMVDACSAHDGTWAMKKEYFALSMKWGEKAFAGMREAEAQVMASDCQLAGLQIEQATGTRPLHPIEILARAYRADGFPDPVEAESDGSKPDPVA